eukprot:943694-Pyramimonas_sp.AAC.1
MGELGRAGFTHEFAILKPSCGIAGTTLGPTWTISGPLGGILGLLRPPSGHLGKLRGYVGAPGLWDALG